MATAAYTLGVLDTLVKAGEVSPAYAAGVVDVLTKQADYNPFWYDSAATNFQEEKEKFIKQHPGRMRDGTLHINPDEATALVDRSRHWWDDLGARSKTYWGNRLDKWTTGLGQRLGMSTSKKTPEQFDRELRVAQNANRRDYMNRERNNGLYFDPNITAAVEDAHVRDANYMREDAKRLYGAEGAKRLGYGENYADEFRSVHGRLASRGGSTGGGTYTPRYDLPKPDKPRPGYGVNVPNSFGAGAQNIYKRPTKLI